MERKYIVYKHITPSGKIYIGQTYKTIEERAGCDGCFYKCCPYFYKAIKKYGWNNIEHIIISSDLTKKEADWLEKYLILYYETTNSKYGYNLTLGGDGTAGRIVSQETRDKMAAGNRGKFVSEETRHKQSLVRKGNMPNMRAVEQYKNGVLIASYKSIAEASEVSGVCLVSIYDSLKGRTGKRARFQFKYK